MMKRFLIILSILLFGATSYAAELQPYAFPFVGKWNPSDPPLLIEDYGLQDIQNLRKDGKHFKGVKGHSKINTTALTDLYVVNGFHFRKDQPQESHVIVYAGDALTPTTGDLYVNTTAIPSAGNFSATVLYTPTTFTDTFRFSNAPDGNMVSSNAAETLIWGGDEQRITAFLTSAANITSALTLTTSFDFSEALMDASDDDDNTALLSAGIDAYTVLLLHANGTDASTTFTDSSASAHTVTAVADAQIDTAYQKFGTGSGLFDGTGDWLTVLDHANWYLADGDFTIDFWAKPNGTGSFCVGQWVDADNYWYFRVTIDINFTYQVYFVVESSGDAKAIYLGAGTIGSAWKHFAIVRDGATMYFFDDGVSKTFTAVTAISTNEVPNLASVLYVGACGATSATQYVANGWMDEVRISKGKARYTTNFTPPVRETSVASNYFLVGSKRPLQGVKFYVEEANTETSTLTGYEWTGSAWSSLTLTDGTADGGVTLAQTGSVTFDSTIDTSKMRYISGYALYWYKFYFDAGQTVLSYVTVDAPIQSIKNIWDGIEVNAVKAKKYDGTTYSDATNTWGTQDRARLLRCKTNPTHYNCINSSTDFIDLLGDNSDVTYMDISELQTTQSLLLGFTEQMQGFDIRFVPAKINTTAATTATIKYWNGEAWVNAAALVDKTSAGAVSFKQNGIMSFSPQERTQEFKRTLSDEFPLYYYQIAFDKNLSTNVHISELRGIPAPAKVESYLFSAEFANRLFLFNKIGGEKNAGRYSMIDVPDIFNGDDSGTLYFGNESDIIAAASIYNTFAQIGGLEQLIVTKKNEAYRLTGNGPENWNLQKISENVGCIAPLSMVAADVTEVDNAKRQVAIWVSDKGVHITDGSTVQTISDDIKCYFDPSDVRYIPAAMQSKSVGWYDPTLKSYKLLIASGSSATYLNTELEYSIKYKEWTKIYRESGAAANPLQSGWQVYDTNGLSYTYGGGKLGYVYRLENTNRWDDTRITSYLQTKDLLLDQQLPLLRQSTVKYLQTVHKKKQTGAITIRHFGDGVETYSGTGRQMGPEAITAANALAYGYDTQSVLLGPYLYHSFKYEATTNIADGLELTGMAVYHEPYTAIR